MSLMNDALRKKKRETTGSQPPAGFSDKGRRLRMTRNMGVVVLVALILLGGAVFGGLYLQQVAGNGSLGVRPPLPPVSRPAVGFAAGESKVAGKSTETVVVQAVATDRPIPATADPIAENSGVTGGSQFPDQSTAAVTVDPPLPHSDNPGPEIATVPEKPATPRDNTPGAAAQTGVADSYRQSPRTFEPDPGRAVNREKRGQSAKKQLRASADKKAKERKTTDISDEDTELFYRKALAFHRSGRLAEAVRLYRQVLKFDATHSEAMLNLAAAYIEEGNFNQAQPLLIRLEQASPRPGGVLLNLAITAIGSGSPARALDYLDRAEKLGDATPWEIDFHRAVALSHMNRSAEALTLYRQLATQRPDDPRVRFNLAITCDTLGLYQEALDHYEVVLRDSKQSSQNNIGTIIERMRSIRRYLNTTQSQAKRQ